MRMLSTYVSVFSFLILATYADWDVTEQRRCRSYVSGDIRSKSNGSRFGKEDCSFEKENGEHAVVCVVRIAIDSPPHSDEASSFEILRADNETEERNLTVFVDFSYKFVLFELEEEGGDGNNYTNVRCLRVSTITYEKFLYDDKDRRMTFSIASSIFNVLANAEKIASNVDLLTSSVVGTADVDPECLENEKESFSSCFHKLDVTFNASIPGSDEDIYTGVLNFSITAFQYSHYFPMNFESIQPSFLDRTRRGKILLRNLPGDNITELRLPKNKWKYLDDSELPRKVISEELLPKLEIIDLSLNNFGQYESGVIGKNGILTVINISDSSLTELPFFIKQQPKLKVLIIGGNPFKYEDASILSIDASNLMQLEVLNISGFTTFYFVNTTLPKLSHLRELDASNCKMKDIEENSFQFLISLVKIDLSRNTLNYLPQKLFANLKELKYLDLSSNKLREGQGLEFFRHRNWPDVGMQFLDMSSNSLESISDVIAPQSKIKRINLANNVLRDMNGLGVFSEYGQWVYELNLSSNAIPALSQEACSGLSEVQILDIHENQFDCSSCDMPYFKFWLQSNASMNILTIPPEDIRCSAPRSARIGNIKVIDAMHYEEPCRGPDYEMLVGSSFSGIALLASLVGGILYIYRFEVSYVIHMMRVSRRVAKGEGKPHSECIYDAFVSYSGRDRNWVLRVLQPELEESDQKYQLCLHDRNFPLGAFITQNIVDSIDKSRKTILVLSDNFVDSQWCRWEMEMANHKLFNDSRNFLVLIELERLDRTNLPRHLRFLMDTRTYLEWPNETSDSNLIIQDPSEKFNQSITHKTHGGLSEQAVFVFWKRLQEALGDSLYVKEKKAKKEAEIAIKKTKERDPDVPLQQSQFYEEPQHAVTSEMF